MSKIVSTGYVPRPIQQYLHNAMKRFNVLVCHRRFGKTVLVLNEMIDRGLRCDGKNPQYAYVAPTYGQAKRVAWDYLKDFTKGIPGVVVNEAELRVDIPRQHKGDRIRFLLLGAENPGSIRGIYLDGAILDEMGEMHPEIWGQTIRPLLSDRLGWCIFIGTPKGRNMFYDLYNFAKHGDPKRNIPPQAEWFAAMYKSSETNIISKAELESARNEMSEDEYEQEFECSFAAALVGAYYGKEMSEAEKEQRICSIPYSKQCAVETYWDLGMSDAMAVWFVQRVGKEIRIIDYMEETGRGLDWMCGAILRKPYSYDMHNFPHDLAVRELTNGLSRKETAENLLGVKFVNIMAKTGVEDGINAVKMILNQCWFDEKNCLKGIEAMKNYERKWDAKNKIFLPKPLHNWASHAADAFRGMAMTFKTDNPKNRQRQLPTKTKSKFNLFGGS